MDPKITVGSVAPSFVAASTQGLINLKDYAGKWVILLCNPTEFNTSRKNEIIYLLKFGKLFSQKDIALLPVCTDPQASHLQWFYRNSRLPSYANFPIIDDRRGDIANLYGLTYMHDSRQAPSEMTVFIIDPNQNIAKILTYPHLGSKQVNEVLSVVESLKNPVRSTEVEIEVEVESDRTVIHSEKTQPFANTSFCTTRPIVGEYVLGNPENVDVQLLDFVVYAFALINPDGSFSVYSKKYLQDLTKLRIENPNLRVIMAIGGWAADGFSDAALTPTSRYNFAREARRWVQQYGLDGIDIDWEYPGSSASGIKSRPQDGANFTLLLTALRDVLGANAWISVAGTGQPSYIKNVEIAKIAPIINYFNLMAYDFNAGETGAKAATHQSNLYTSELSLNTSVDAQIQALIKAGMPSSQILMGIPFYGRYGATSTKTYDELRKNYINKDGYKVMWDSVAKAPYIVDCKGNFVYSYDNLLSIYFKGLYVAEHCLGGLFSWQSGMDQGNILASGMSQAVHDAAQLEDLLAKSYFVDLNSDLI